MGSKTVAQTNAQTVKSFKPKFKAIGIHTLIYRIFIHQLNSVYFSQYFKLPMFISRHLVAEMMMMIKFLNETTNNEINEVLMLINGVLFVASIATRNHPAPT